MKIGKDFYLNDSVTQVARDLVGKVLCTNLDGQICKAKIVETEAYSFMEKACHAYANRRTKRTEVLFQTGGTAYVYLCYGIHNLFNIVTNKKNIAEAVLIRALEPMQGLDSMLQRRSMNIENYNLTSGPGKLSQAMGISLKQNGLSLLDDTIWIESSPPNEVEITASPRVGVGYAEEDAHLPWRFFMKNNPWISKGNIAY